MTTELKIPDVGESIQEVQIGQWLKQEGDHVALDENIVELETDKASLDLPSPADGTLSKIVKHDGDLVSVGETIAYIERKKIPKGHDDDTAAAPSRERVTREKVTTQVSKSNDDKRPSQSEREADTSSADDQSPARKSNSSERRSIPVTPSGRRALHKYGLSAADIEPSGNRIRREDVEQYAEQHDVASQDDSGNELNVSTSRQDAATEDGKKVGRQDIPNESRDEELSELEELVPMSLIRRRIAERLVQAQQEAALLTTFNEIDMSSVMELRKRYQDRFQQKYNVKLGYMSFFVKATIDALKQLPEINAEIRGNSILYRNYYHIGIAIGSGKGLVVPVLRNAERLSFAEIEKAINDLADRARKNKIGPDELQGGTFTISNGGVYGSLLSTPIVNPPQSGVLGMHTIEDRPVACNKQVVIRPMMYVALTYDHRIVDGQEAVTFLKRIKEAIEEPARMLVEV